MEYFLELSNIEKTFDKKLVLSNLNLKVKKDLVTVIMGPNGTGKTTLINIIIGLTKRDNGSVLIEGSPMVSTLSKEQKKKICYIPDSPLFLEYLTGLENLKYISKMYNKNISVEKLQIIMGEYDLISGDKTIVRDYSRGMKTKLNLCFTEIIDASFIILDEPTIGLDIMSIEYLRNKIFDYKSQGKTILITSHDMEFVRSVADEIYLLNGQNASLLFNSTEKSKIRDINILTDSLLLIIGKNYEGVK